MARFRLGALIVVPALLVPEHAAAQNEPRLRIVVDVSEDGTAGSMWLGMVRRWRPDSAYSAVVDLRKPLSAAERRWADLIRSRSIMWPMEIESLADAYVPVPPPASATIVLGNRGGEDAFVHDGTTIGFDLSALERNYGGAQQPENAARIDRFFRHEYVHLLQKAWLDEHPAPTAAPLDLALLDIWSEGLGNFYSLSSRWRGDDGSLTDHARRTLDALEPRFLARLAALACASSETGESLRADLSSGPFAEKWGALPAALWLAMDEAESAGAVRRFVVAGPEGVWALAKRRLAMTRRAVLSEVRASAARCARQS